MNESTPTLETTKVAARPSATGRVSSAIASVSRTPLLSPEDLERTTALLTRHIGPIAKVVVRRAAVGGVTLQGFLARVSRSIDCRAERELFLRETGASSS